MHARAYDVFQVLSTFDRGSGQAHAQHQLTQSDVEEATKLGGRESTTLCRSHSLPQLTPRPEPRQNSGDRRESPS